MPDQNQRSVVRSLDVVFDSEVNLTATAFQLQNAAGIDVGISQAVRVVNGKTVVSLTFEGPLVDASGSLMDGSYVLTTLDTQVKDLAGNELDGDRDGVPGGTSADEFFRVFGDTDGDGDVDGLDHVLFGRTLLSRIGDDEYDRRFDFDGDGDIDARDAARLRLQRFQRLDF